LVKALKCLAGLIGATVFALFAGLIVFAASISHYTPRTADADARPADAIVVLTGGEQRIREAVRLFGEGGARRLLISGVNRNTTREELRRKAELPAVLFECCIDIGYAALDTIGNAEEAKAWAHTWGFSKIVVVTSNYHMPRGLTELARAMPDIQLVAHPVISRNYQAEMWWLNAAAVRLIVSEYAKFLPTAARFAAARMFGPSENDAATGTRAADAAIEPARPVAATWQRSFTSNLQRVSRY
jgi:uncharacterized SAM-binding protein YcdF (DUF218 family)